MRQGRFAAPNLLLCVPIYSSCQEDTTAWRRLARTSMPWTQSDKRPPCKQASFVAASAAFRKRELGISRRRMQDSNKIYHLYISPLRLHCLVLSKHRDFTYTFTRPTEDNRFHVSFRKYISWYFYVLKIYSLKSHFKNNLSFNSRCFSWRFSPVFSLPKLCINIALTNYTQDNWP